MLNNVEKDSDWTFEDNLLELELVEHESYLSSNGFLSTCFKNKLIPEKISKKHTIFRLFFSLSICL